jgi:hypothetical protein
MKILREYDWNSHRYVVVQKDDGTTIEVKDQKDPIETVTRMVAKEVAMEIKADIPAVQKIPDSDLVSEAMRRKLTISVKGAVL